MSKKYSELLKDPRWQKKRLEIFARDNWTCQRCHDKTETLNVHHTNGYRKNLKPWEYPDSELLTLCEPCHKAQHEPHKPLNFYLAGKIEKNCWRHKLIPDLRGAAFQPEGEQEHGRMILLNAICDKHNYCGPFFICCDHGCAHVPEHHGCHANGCTESFIERYNLGRENAFRNCLSNICNCDVFCAWINSTDCYGTLAEIGLAYALRKMIFIGMNKPFDSLWFAQSMATHGLYIFPDPQSFINRVVIEVDKL